MSQTACWGTNKLERCAWISFGYGSIHDISCFWVSLEAAKALARLDYGPLNINSHEWYTKPEEYKKLCPRLRMSFSAWHVSVPDDKEESLLWWEEIEKEMGKHGLRESSGDLQKILKDHPEDAEIYERCRMMERRSEEARHGYQDICHDETSLNVCTEDNRWYNGGGRYRDFMSEEEVLLTGDDDIDALIISKAVLTQFIKTYGSDWMELAIAGKTPPEVDMSEVNPFDSKNICGTYVEKVKVEGTLFTVILGSCEGRVGSRFIYTFDRSEAIPDWEYINKRKAEWAEQKLEEEKEAEFEMFEWGESWEEMSGHPKCRYEYNENFNGNGIFDHEVYLPRKNFGFCRYGCPEKTELGDWYIFGGPLMVKEFVQSKGRGNSKYRNWAERGRNYQCRPHNFFIFGGTIGAPEYDHGPNKDYWQNPALP